MRDMLWINDTSPINFLLEVELSTNSLHCLKKIFLSTKIFNLLGIRHKLYFFLQFILELNSRNHINYTTFFTSKFQTMQSVDQKNINDHSRQPYLMFWWFNTRRRLFFCMIVQMGYTTYQKYMTQYFEKKVL